jgi:four helix bundle protein
MAGIRRVEDIEAYQLAVALRRRVLGIVASGRIRNDWKFIDQIRDSVRGASRNISEGFSRFAPGEFSQFLSYAKASLDETRNHIEDGFESGYSPRRNGTNFSLSSAVPLAPYAAS